MTRSQKVGKMTYKCKDCGLECQTKRSLSRHRTESHDDCSIRTVYCANCGKEKELPQSKIERSENIFCNHECYGEYISGKDSPSSDSVERKCDYCNEKIYVWKSDLTENNFCNEECRDKFQSENRQGQDNPRWKEDSVDAIEYSEKWYDVKPKVISRDNNVCQKCSKTKEEVGRQLPVHHIVRPEKFESEDNAHITENLIQLCLSCHPIVENMKTKEQFKYHPENSGEWFFGN